MTLVVGELVAGGPVLWADTALSKENDPRSGFFGMGLKLVVVHPGLCVAYAGGAEDALRAILGMGVDRHTGYDVDDVRDRLLAAHVSMSEATDFLIASLIPVPSLIRVSDGKAVDLQRTFIGLPSAYGAYHDQYDTSGLSIAEVGERMDGAMETLIQDKAVEDVGGISIGVAPGEAGFEYRPPWATIASTVKAGRKRTHLRRLKTHPPAGQFAPVESWSTRRRSTTGPESGWAARRGARRANRSAVRRRDRREPSFHPAPTWHAIDRQFDSQHPPRGNQPCPAMSPSSRSAQTPATSKTSSAAGAPRRLAGPC